MDISGYFPVRILVGSLYLLAMINPVSKVSVLSPLAAESPGGEFRALAARSSLTAVFILFTAMLLGDFILRSIFRVELHSLRIAGGTVLFWVGFNALRKGVFFERGTSEKYQDIALVPLACPMIAGPATIAAGMAMRARVGLLESSLAMLAAVGVNYLVMRSTVALTGLLSRHNLLGAIIRITGLIAMTIGTQMALDGFAEWLERN